MPRILVLFASSHGQTLEIARSLANHLRRHGHAVDLVDAEDSAPPSPETYEAVVIGSRVLFGRYARSIRRYVARHVQVLCEMPSAFFSVSMSVVGGKPDPYLPAFLEETGWKPELTISLAGGLPYRSYNPLLRLVMKRISRKFGHTTDTSRDHDFTDWGAVRRFAAEVARTADGEQRELFTPLPAPRSSIGVEAPGTSNAP
jgi:menaquinone-dependent protoporphyrinogen oxidase